MANLNLLYLPEVIALTILIAGFRPLLRRAGQHADAWFVAFGFLLLHFTALLLTCDVPPAPYLMLASRWSLDLCVLTFILAAERDGTQRIPRALAPVLALPVLLEAALASYVHHPAALDRLTVLLFLAPGLYLSMPRGSARRQGRVTGVAWLLLGGSTLWFAFGELAIAYEAALCILLLAAAYLFVRSAPVANRGVLAAAAGLAWWGLTVPLAGSIAGLLPSLHLSRVALELPIALATGGILLTLLEEHVERTERMATHDALTDLPNLRMFNERFSAALQEAHSQRTTIACLVIDIDNFKTVNDTLGHDAGDQLLKALAVRLAWHLTPRDLLARTGGDEFTALLAGVTDEHHLRFIASSMMSAAGVPVLVDGRPVEVRISIGIALSPDHADDMDGLRRAADRAMYSAKRRGGSLLAYAGED